MRWAVLAELAACALLYALTRRSRPAAPNARTLLAVSFLALALVSALWSATPGLTAARALSLAALFATAGAIAYGARGRPEVVAYVLLGVLAGAAVVAVGGLVHLAWSPDNALVPATRQSPSRFNGLGANPNTMALLLAIALPLALWALLEARSRLGKALAAGTLLLFAASLAASGSRGALLGALAGVLALVLALEPRGRLRPALALAAVAVFALGVGAMQLPQPAERDPVLNPEFGRPFPLGPRDAQFTLPLENEIGFPSPHATPFQRTLLTTSGRTVAWSGAVDQIRERPLLGYGFGTEERVFVDRFYLFYSSLVESSYLGTMLQLGLAGLVLLSALLLAVLAGGWRSLRRRDGPARTVAAACLGVLACGLVLALTQSFLTSVGSPAAAPFWLCAFLLGTAAAGEVREREGDEG